MSRVRSYSAQNNAHAKTGRVNFTMHTAQQLCLSALVLGKSTHQSSKRNMASGLPIWRASLAAQAFAPKLTTICLLGLRVAHLNWAVKTKLRNQYMKDLALMYSFISCTHSLAYVVYSLQSQSTTSSTKGLKLTSSISTQSGASKTETFDQIIKIKLIVHFVILQ